MVRHVVLCNARCWVKYRIRRKCCIQSNYVADIVQWWNRPVSVFFFVCLWCNTLITVLLLCWIHPHCLYFWCFVVSKCRIYIQPFFHYSLWSVLRVCNTAVLKEFSLASKVALLHRCGWVNHNWEKQRGTAVQKWWSGSSAAHVGYHRAPGMNSGLV